MAVHKASTLPPHAPGHRTYTCIYTDSLQSVRELSHIHTTSRLAKYIIQTAKTLQDLQHTLQIEWVPSHVGITGNEEAHRLVTSALHDTSLETWSGPPPTLFPEYDPITIKKQEHRDRKKRLAALRPDQPHHYPPHLTRWEAVALRRLRTNTAIDPPKLALFQRLDDNATERVTCTCGAINTAKHRIWTCPKTKEARDLKLRALPTPPNTLEEWLFPEGPIPRQDELLYSLLAFLKDANLTSFI